MAPFWTQLWDNIAREDDGENFVPRPLAGCAPDREKDCIEGAGAAEIPRVSACYARAKNRSCQRGGGCGGDIAPETAAPEKNLRPPSEHTRLRVGESIDSPLFDVGGLISSEPLT